ncbi:MAG: histone deacetylase [Bacillota bacterium]|nr:histone deacetylase [Bacillota bacterium]MDW7684155.1 histone deacetylase [Bacillota bacterium]
MKENTRIGIVYHPDFFIHTKDSHPEKKERLQAILSLLKQENLFSRLQQLAPAPASVGDVARVHTRQHIEFIRTLCEQHKGYLDIDTYLTPQSYDVALLSAGAALAAMRSVMNGKLDICFALGRPPGHHAEPHKGMGFCLFNNGAIAAKAAQEEFGLSRILYIDWDVHHGNGTQKAFYHDPGLLFASVHQSPAFPGTGPLHETGAGEGEGYNVNIPLPPGCGDREYARVFREVIRPLADRYKPELILVSAGQDTYHDDPLAGMRVSFDGFADMARQVRDLAKDHCDGKVVLFLEGGYHLRGQAEAVVTILSEMGEWGRPVRNEPSESDPLYDDPDRVIEEVIRMHKL